MVTASQGWDFVKLGGFYQFREDNFIAKVKVIKDNSDEKYYNFRLEIQPHPGFPSTVPDSTIVPEESGTGSKIFEVGYKKGETDFFGLDMHFYEWDKRPYFSSEEKPKRPRRSR